MKTNYWTKQRCQQEALNYKTRTEFYKKSTGAYHVARKNDWLNSICGHMITKRSPKGYWTKQKCQQVALKYNSRMKFKLNEGGAYNVALKNKWLDDISSHMMLFRTVNYFVYLFEFSDNSVYVGLTQRPDTRKNQHLLDINSKVYKHIQQSGLQPEFKILAETSLNNIGMILEKSILDDYKNNGYKIIN